MWQWVFSHLGTHIKLHYTLSDDAVLTVHKYHQNIKQSTTQKKIKTVNAALDYMSEVSQKYQRGGYHVHIEYPPQQASLPAPNQSRPLCVADLCDSLGDDALALNFMAPTNAVELQSLLQDKHILQFAIEGQKHETHGRSVWETLLSFQCLPMIHSCIFEHHWNTLVRQIGEHGSHWGSLAGWQTLLPELRRLRITENLTSLGNLEHKNCRV